LSLCNSSEGQPTATPFPSAPGSRGALLLPSPLRTTRKPFGFCRSRLSQGPSPNPAGRNRSTCTRLVWGGRASNAGDRTSSKLPSSALSPKPVVQTVTCGDTRGKSARFRGGSSRPKTQPLSHRLPGGIRFFPHPLPAAPSAPPYGGPTPKRGRRAYHVPRMEHGWLRPCWFAGGSTATAREGRRPCTWPRTVWFKPVSAFGLLVLTTLIRSSPGFALPSTLAPDRLGASPDISRRLSEVSELIATSWVQSTKSWVAVWVKSATSSHR
jgi:hypothetical protein